MEKFHIINLKKTQMKKDNLYISKQALSLPKLKHICFAFKTCMFRFQNIYVLKRGILSVTNNLF